MRRGTWVPVIEVSTSITGLSFDADCGGPDGRSADTDPGNRAHALLG
jgi:hypothetical protein